MAEQDIPNIDPNETFGLVRAALDPDERKFFKAYLGEESPTLSDWISPQGRFAGARKVREGIMSTVLQHALTRAQAPTLGEAQAMFPGFPVPPGANKSVQNPIALQGPGAPMQTGVMPVELQGPGRPVPSGAFQPEQSVAMPDRYDLPPSVYASDDVFKSPLQQIPEGLRGIGGTPLPGPKPIMEEGPRPMGYAPAMSEGPQPTGVETKQIVDPGYKLPPSFVSYLGQLQHREGLRQPVVHQPTADETKYKDALGYGLAAWAEANPGKQPSAKDMLEIYRGATGYYDKAPAPGTDVGRKVKAEATIAEVKAANEATNQTLTQGELKTRSTKNQAEADSTMQSLDARIAELRSRARLQDVQAGQVGQKAAMLQLKNDLDLNKHVFKMVQFFMADKSLTEQARNEAIRNLFERVDTGLQAVPEEKGVLEDFFGVRPKYNLIPKQGETGTRQQQAPALTPPPEAEAPAQKDDATALREMGTSMKEGEVREYKGAKYRRSKGKLERVK